MAGWITKKKENEWEDIIGTMPSITGEQAAVSTPLSEYLAETLAGIGGQPTFEDWTTGNVPAMFGGVLGSQAQNAYSEALTGAFPEEYYQSAIYQPTMTEWMEDIMPAIRESYVATGAITGTEVGERLGKEGRRLGEYLAGAKATLGQQAKERAYGAAGAYQTAWYNQLNLAYQNYIAQYPDTATILQAALNYLNIPLMAAYQKPEEGGGKPKFGATIARGSATPKEKKDYYEWKSGHGYTSGYYANVGQTPQMII